MNVFTDPSFSGLHWSIDPDTPENEREQAHQTAALVARAIRDRPQGLTVEPILEDPCTDRYFVQWPNGSRTWVSKLYLAKNRIKVLHVTD